MQAIIEPQKQAFASESCHYYLSTGEPFYTVTSKNGAVRPVTLRDARKVGAFPSVTTVTKVCDKPALNAYYERQIFDACSDFWKKYAFPPDFDLTKAQSREHSKAKAERGSALHGDIERFLSGQKAKDFTWEPHIAALVLATVQYGLDLRLGAPEKSFAHALGFGGKVDWHFGGLVTDPAVVIDFKTKDCIEAGKKYAYDEHAMQLAAYREGLGIPNARCLNIFVGADDRKVLIHEWPEEDLARGWRMFKLLLAFWQEKNNYKP